MSKKTHSYRFRSLKLLTHKNGNYFKQYMLLHPPMGDVYNALEFLEGFDKSNLNHHSIIFLIKIIQPFFVNLFKFKLVFVL